jgi:hypothetical protein
MFTYNFSPSWDFGGVNDTIYVKGLKHYRSLSYALLVITIGGGVSAAV